VGLPGRAEVPAMAQALMELGLTPEQSRLLEKTFPSTSPVFTEAPHQTTLIIFTLI